MSYWCFALVNGKLAELHYDKLKNSERRLYAHCYVKNSAYKTKREKKWIKEETKNARFTFRNKEYVYLGTRPLRYTTGSLKELLS